ncbi:hypothetical protein [Streptomyces sp. NPDC029704]|uniref:hypothetical protein n=1 Tax=Streptomyces sp. NPDC029704 TaxID=3156920 RepID=UPI0033CC84D8
MTDLPDWQAIALAATAVYLTVGGLALSLLDVGMRAMHEGMAKTYPELDALASIRPRFYAGFIVISWVLVWAAWPYFAAVAALDRFRE